MSNLLPDREEEVENSIRIPTINVAPIPMVSSYH